MKLNISRTMLLAVALLVFNSASRAQEINVRAHVPFDFVAGDKAYPAGEYAIKTAMANTAFLSIKKEGGETQGLTRSRVCISSSSTIAGDQARLIFHRTGNTYFLFRVWVGGSTIGREFPTSPREAEVAKNGPKTETITVAGNRLR